MPVENIISLGKAIVELGFSAAAMLLVIGLVVWHQYRIVPIMNALVYSSQRLIESADKLAEGFDGHHTMMSSHDKRAEDMHVTCREHGKQIDELSNRLARMEGRLQT